MIWQIKTKDGKIYGPVESEVLRRWVQEKRIVPEEDFVWVEGKKEWVIINSVPEIQNLFKEGAQPEIKQEVSVVKASGEREHSDVLFDDKNMLTFQLIADAWRAMLAKGIWSILGAVALMGIILSVSNLLLNLIPFLGFVGYLIIQAAFTLGWTAYSLKIARREEVGVAAIFEGFKGQYIWCALGAVLLMGLLTALASLVSFGIWGFYLTFAYILTYLFIFDGNKGPWEAMKASYDVTKGYKWRIMAVQIICMLLGILTLGIGLFVTVPLANIALASLYYRIRTECISERHLQTSAGEYFIVLIPFILMIVLFVLIFAGPFAQQLSSLAPQIEGYLKNLPQGGN